ncbi:PKD domain-containing protein, partial [bacterium]|nr:PKD domain-containing protein [bacterium]
SIRKKNFIKVGKAPATPTVIASSTNLCDVNQKVKLSTTSTTGIAKYTWNVGQILYRDSSHTVTHKFIRTGYFDVGLTVEDDYGCQTTKVYDSLILVERKPQITLNVGDTAFCDTHTLFLNPTFNMYAQKGFTYSWSLPGSNLTGSANKVPGKLFYSTRGSYTFALDAISQGNCKYHYNFPDTLKIGKSVSLKHRKKVSAPCNVQTYTISLLNTSSFVANIQWKFQGDSLTAKTSNSGATLSYRKVGNYKYIISHNDLGCLSEVSGVNTVTLRTLKAQFKLDPQCSCSPNDTFKASNTTNGLTATSTYLWEVTDAKDQVVFSTNKLSPQIILNGYGVYGLQLTVRDTSGCVDSVYKYGAIRMESPNIGISAEPKVACVGSDVRFGVDSICQSGFKSAVWKFYDHKHQLAATSTDEFPVVSFPKAGKYSVELVYNTSKCSDSVTRKAVVEVVSLQSINYTLSDTTPCEGSVINASLKVQPDNIQPKVNWTISHVTKPGITFKASEVIGQDNEYLIKPNTSGIYNMKIVVNGGKGCRDSLEVKSLIKVSGIKADFTADEVVGCLPFKTTLRTAVSKNEHYDHPADNSVTYDWQIVPNNAATIKKPTSSTTDILITETGSYNVFVNVTNADGCSQGILKDDLFKFDFNASFSIDTVTCQNVLLHPTNNTPGTNIAYYWYCKEKGAVFETKQTIKQPMLRFANAGTYTLVLVATTKSGCSDSFEKTITVHPFSFDFSVANNTPKCTPAQYIFNIKSNNVDTFHWLFGDGKGIVTDQKSIAHVYDLSQVKPFRNDFNVGLVGQNNFGCIDTLRYNNLIHVLGPNPTFKIANGVGCDPTEIKFIDSTEQVARFYFNYDDGSSVDSLSFSSHIYHKKDSTKSFEVFKPYIIASDKNNCFVYYQPEDSIVIYANPVARFWTRKTNLCSPALVNFKNHSKFAVSSYWDYTNNNQKIDTALNGRKTYHAGTFSVKLKVKNKIGCVDSLVKTRYLTIFEKPLALFNESDTIICPKRLINFEDQTNAAFQIKKWKWTFTGPNLNDSAFGQNQQRAFKDTGYYSVRLIATDINGCSDTLEKNHKYHIVNRLPIKSPLLYYVTVEQNKAVNLQWNALDAMGFQELLIIKNDDYANPVRRITNFKTVNISLPETEVVNAPIQYQLKLIDRCADPNRESVKHRTIHLTATRNERPFAILNWTKYRGWTNVDQYVVYRSESGSDYQEIARISHTDTTFTDYSVCDKTYYYLIGSVNPVSSYITYSNVVEYNPYYNSPADSVRLELVTVDGENILVKWNNNINLNVQNYFIDRYDDFSGWQKAYTQTQDTFFIDQSVEENRLSYKYRVWYRDFCNNRNPPSNEGSSILLLGEISNEDFVYHWNGYEKWDNGVSAYIMEKTQDLSKPFKEVAILGSEARTIIDNKKAIRSDSSFYVRIKAIENGNLPDTSYSNIIKVYPEPVIYLPNAFSPNRDNVNDVLKFDGLGFKRDEFSEFNFMVFNRWGEKVFETSVFGEYWDGRFNNSDCPPGIYTYFMKIRGVNNTKYNYTGNVLLIR